MSEDVVSNLGARLHIGTQTATFDQSTAAADTYTEVGDIEDFGGDFGISFQAIEFTPVGTGETDVKKGSANYGGLTLQLGRNVSDTGQAAMKAAAEDTTSKPYNIKITLNDNPDEAGDGTPTTFYLRSLVMSYRTTQGAANGVVGATAEIRVTKKPIEVAADAGAA